MRPMLKKLPLMICVIAISGCSSPFGKEGYLRDKSGDYTQEKVAKPLQIPEDLPNAKALGDNLVIPKVTKTDKVLPEKFVVPRTSLRVTGQGGGDIYSIEQTGDDVWLQATQDPADMWSHLKAFFQEKKIPLSIQNEQEGILETEWMNFHDNSGYDAVLRSIGKLLGQKDLTPMEDLFHIEVRKGEEGTSEVHIKVKERPVVAKGTTPPAVPAKWNNLEERSLQINRGLASDLIFFFTNKQHSNTNSTSYQDQTLDIRSSVTLTKGGNDEPLLNIKGISYNRSWSAVGDALKAAGVSITDRDRSSGLYYLATDAQDLSSKKKQGFFARLFGSDSKKTQKNDQGSLLVRLSQFPQFIQVSVEKDTSTSIDKETSETLLKMIRDNLK